MKNQNNNGEQLCRLRLEEKLNILMLENLQSQLK